MLFHAGGYFQKKLNPSFVWNGSWLSGTSSRWNKFTDGPGRITLRDDLTQEQL